MMDDATVADSLRPDGQIPFVRYIHTFSRMFQNCKKKIYEFNNLSDILRKFGFRNPAPVSVLSCSGHQFLFDHEPYFSSPAKQRISLFFRWHALLVGTRSREYAETESCRRHAPVWSKE